MAGKLSRQVLRTAPREHHPWLRRVPDWHADAGLAVTRNRSDQSFTHGLRLGQRVQLSGGPLHRALRHRIHRETRRDLVMATIIQHNSTRLASCGIICLGSQRVYAYPTPSGRHGRKVTRSALPAYLRPAQALSRHDTTEAPKENLDTWRCQYEWYGQSPRA